MAGRTKGACKITKKVDPFYMTPRWRSLRASALKRDNYQCQYCKTFGLMRQADYVHHVFPKDTYIQYQYELWNTMSLCRDCHEQMHNRFTGKLSRKGLLQMRGLAAVRGIKLNLQDETILVVGLRGSGKTTYCRKHMDDDSIVYDMDAIAGAFRLQPPDREYYKPARRMANDFLFGFVAKAHDYCRKVFIVRTAPKIKEVEQIDPTKIVFCKSHYILKEMDDPKAAAERLKELEEHCKISGMDFEIIEEE